MGGQSGVSGRPVLFREQKVNGSLVVMSNEWHMTAEATDWLQHSEADHRPGSKQKNGKHHWRLK